MPSIQAGGRATQTVARDGELLASWPGIISSERSPKRNSISGFRQCGYAASPCAGSRHVSTFVCHRMRCRNAGGSAPSSKSISSHRATADRHQCGETESGRHADLSLATAEAPEEAGDESAHYFSKRLTNILRLSRDGSAHGFRVRIRIGEVGNHKTHGVKT
jgi:hypothetical protein